MLGAEIIHRHAFLFTDLFISHLAYILFSLIQGIKYAPFQKYFQIQQVLGIFPKKILMHLNSLQVLSKRTFLCTTDFDEAYFDFHCLPSGKPPGNGVDWYTVCGTPYPNKAEYLAIVGTVCFLSLIVYHEIFRRRSVKNSFGNINESKKRM